ncbi:hypothetical protein EV191_11491 [Tamaricihabitans halophyticus]|uniref:Uncharacterized protein n=1 Tax=Tamaricihabitans halophyticus TaxID=1262583 RepID=A0A4R2QD11_9PSEU|nr:hypothetical protein [Tamaricihabitans halophyticus]TCP46294.1 hypothetical protein EV191_11491 [Tamaricihabitans halophyticus]
MPINPLTLPWALGAAGLAAVRAAGELVLALPRIARALEQLAPAGPALSQLADLRGTVQRLEQLGNFLAEELPEAVFQLEGLRARLSAVERQLGSATTEFTAIDAALRDLQATLERVRPLDRTPNATRKHSP